MAQATVNQPFSGGANAVVVTRGLSGTFSGQQLAPTGCTTPPYSFSVDATTGICRWGVSSMSVQLAGNSYFAMVPGEFRIRNGSGVSFSTGDPTSVGADVLCHRTATKTVTCDDNASGAATVAIIGNLTATTSVKTGATTVAALPTCNSAAQGTRLFVTDANSATFMATAAGGGANNMPVVCDGTNWKIG